MKLFLCRVIVTLRQAQDDNHRHCPAELVEAGRAPTGWAIRYKSGRAQAIALRAFHFCPSRGAVQH